MTYPLASYSYSFQRRIRELAAPVEAYHLQLADIDETIALRPLQMAYVLNALHLPALNIEDKDENITVEPVVEGEEVLFQPSKIIVQGEDSPATQYFTPELLMRIDTTQNYTIELINCYVDQEFLNLTRYRNGNLPRRDTCVIECHECVISAELTVNNTYEDFNFQVVKCEFEGAYFKDVADLLLRDKHAFKCSDVTVYGEEVYEMLEKIQEDIKEAGNLENPAPTSYEQVSLYIDKAYSNGEEMTELRLGNNVGFMNTVKKLVSCSIL
uniref:Recep_L_domain domain-containing protein n=1 Tax=Panagrellus redivivus TaxID=6233 RepID=A0A7E4W8M0_PANRE